MPSAPRPGSGAAGRRVGIVRGRVVDMRERPIEDAVVTVESGPNRPDIAAGTGPDGAFMLNNLTLGRYLLRADAEGFAPGFTEVQVLPQRPARAVRIRLVQQS